MKIVITIQAASDGGAFITMDPSVERLIEQVDAGTATSAHGYALAAYKAIKAQAEAAAAAGAYMEAGEIPPNRH